MNVLVVGSGGREHALVWAIGRSPSVGKVYASPGNPGTAAIAENVRLDPSDFQGISDFCAASHVDLVVVGPENPLADGIADFLRERGVAVFGPGKAGAVLESSKSAAKEFMRRHGVPHASTKVFHDAEQAREHVTSIPGPFVVKADGLALGKGVTITRDRDEALDVVSMFMSGAVHGAAGKRIVIEEFLTGKELTAMALTDGRTLFPLPFARDHKRVFEGDKGPMTGGMGAYSPVPLARTSGVSGAAGDSQGLEQVILEDVLQRTLDGLKEDGIDYRGVLYAGLMLTESGPKVLEYNVRFGDPETECVLPLLGGDFARALMACAEGRLADYLKESRGERKDSLRVLPDACVTVVMASAGYPGSYRKGLPISGVERATAGDGVVVFHAGTRVDGGRLVTSGGRVLAVTATGSSIQAAAEKAYAAAGTIEFDGAYFRGDIVADTSEGS